MGYYPINIDINGKRVLVVGGGSVAERKVMGLIEFKAKVTVVSPEITPQLNKLKEDGKIVWEPRTWRPGDLEGVFLAFAATNDRVVNQEIYKEAKSRNVLLNSVDQPDLCTFTIPALVKREDLIIAISTSGQSPALSAFIRKKLEGDFGDEYGRLTGIVGSIRKRLIEKGQSPEELKDKFKELFSSDILENIRSGDEDGIQKIVDSIFGEGWL